MEDFENKILKKEKELEQIVNKEKVLIIVKGKMLSGKTTLVLSLVTPNFLIFGNIGYSSGYVLKNKRFKLYSSISGYAALFSEAIYVDINLYNSFSSCKRG